MRCMYCEFETVSINTGDKIDEMNTHIREEHVTKLVPLQFCRDIVEISYKYKLSISSVINDMLTARDIAANRGIF